MKRILWLIVVFMIVGLGANAEGNFISGEEAERIARADLQAYSGLTDDEMSDFITQSGEVEDWSFKDMGMARNVESIYYVHPGLPDLSISHFISATDGKMIRRFDTPFQDGKDFVRYYHSIAACSDFLYAQEALEETHGPFRTWSEAKQQEFYAQYGNHSDFLNEQHYPLPTDVQSWEARRAADQFMMGQYGYTEETLAQFYVETDHDYMEFHPDFWSIRYKRDREDISGILIEVHHEDGVILEVEGTCSSLDDDDDISG